MGGTPDTMLEKLKYLCNWLGTTHLIMYGQQTRMFHDDTMANLGLFVQQVLPSIKDW